MKRISSTLIVIFVSALLLSACAALGETNEPDTRDAHFPTFVYDSALSLKAYKIAVRIPNLLFSIPCYCDCGRASGHKSLHDCFFNADGTFNDHASGCEVCGLEALDIAKWQGQGKSLKEIRTMIDAKYAAYGHATDTPAVQ